MTDREPTQIERILACARSPFVALRIHAARAAALSPQLARDVLPGLLHDESSAVLEAAIDASEAHPPAADRHALRRLAQMGLPNVSERAQRLLDLSESGAAASNPPGGNDRGASPARGASDPSAPVGRSSGAPSGHATPRPGTTTLSVPPRSSSQGSGPSPASPGATPLAQLPATARTGLWGAGPVATSTLSGTASAGAGQSAGSDPQAAVGRHAGAAPGATAHTGAGSSSGAGALAGPLAADSLGGTFGAVAGVGAAGVPRALGGAGPGAAGQPIRPVPLSARGTIGPPGGPDQDALEGGSGLARAAALLLLGGALGLVLRPLLFAHGPTTRAPLAAGPHTFAQLARVPAQHAVEALASPAPGEDAGAARFARALSHALAAAVEPDQAETLIAASRRDLGLPPLVRTAARARALATAPVAPAAAAPAPGAQPPAIARPVAPPPASAGPPLVADTPPQWPASDRSALAAVFASLAARYLSMDDLQRAESYARKALAIDAHEPRAQQVLQRAREASGD